MASADAGRRRGADWPLCPWLFLRARRMEGDAQVCGEGRRLPPRPCAWALGWAISAALGLGNFWPIVPAPLVPSRLAVPQAQRVKQVPRPARRYWRRARAVRPRPPRYASPTWVREAGAAATGSRAAGPGPRSAGEGGRREGDAESGPAPGKQVGGGSAQEERNPSPAARSGCTLWLATAVPVQDPEERGRKWANRGPGQRVEETLHSHRPHLLREKCELSLKRRAHTTGTPALPLQKHRCNNVQK